MAKRIILIIIASSFMLNAQWVLQNPYPTISFLMSVKFVDTQTGWVVGNYGTILRTTNGGENWISYGTPDYGYLTTLDFIDAQTGWIAGFSGAILKTTNGGVTYLKPEIQNETPASISLSQNFPNPFNPSTVVNFSLPASGVVTVKLYNIQGREVATILNEFKDAGNHSFFIDATKYGLSSGVYLYRMTTGGTAITRKMVLLR
jgi:hypothetical protein